MCYSYFFDVFRKICDFVNVINNGIFSIAFSLTKIKADVSIQWFSPEVKGSFVYAEWPALMLEFKATQKPLLQDKVPEYNF